MNGMTEAQKTTLKKIKGARLVTRLHTGALVVVYAQQYHDARVIDNEGEIWSFSQYLAVIDHGSRRMSYQQR
jgi:hypothetical protein